MNSQILPWKTLSASLQVGVLTDGWTLATIASEATEEARVFRYTIYFTTPFEAPPVVHLGLNGFDLDQRDSNRLNIAATEITATSFVVEVSTWRDTRVYSVSFGWFALGA